MADRSHLLLTALVCLATLAATEWLAHRISQDGPGPSSDWHRASNVTALAKDPTDLPKRWNSGPSVLLIGNSHAYALPGLERGRPLRPDPGATLIDELAARLGESYPQTHFYRLAYPNFLSFEMLTRVAQLQRQGLRPTVVVLGLTFRNLARGSETRRQIRQLFRDPGFGESLGQRLGSKADLAGNAPEVFETLASEQRRAVSELALERQRSAADRFDRLLSSWAGQRLQLLGRSNELRAAVYRKVALTIDDLLVRKEGIDYVYGVVDRDLHHNLASLRALLRMLTESGSRVLVYQAPERDDFPPLIDPARQQPLMDSLQDEFAKLDTPLVDGRHTVPNKYWGWVYNTPDRSHFTEPGHRLLADFLVGKGQRLGIWQALESSEGELDEAPEVAAP